MEVKNEEEGEEGAAKERKSRSGRERANGHTKNSFSNKY